MPVAKHMRPLHKTETVYVAHGNLVKVIPLNYAHFRSHTREAPNDHNETMDLLVITFLATEHNVMKTTAKIITIGNSRGIRLPKKALEESGLSDEVELETGHSELTIRSKRTVREGREESYITMAKLGQDRLLLGMLSQALPVSG